MRFPILSNSNIARLRIGGKIRYRSGPYSLTTLGFFLGDMMDDYPPTKIYVPINMEKKRKNKMENENENENEKVL